MVRTERESDRRRREEKWQTCWCCRDQQRACKMAQALAEELEHTGPAEKERVALAPQREQLASKPEPPCQEEQEQSRLSKAPDRDEGESQGGREPHLGERERNFRARAWRGKSGVLSEGRQIPRMKGRTSKESLPRRCRWKHKRVSERKSSPE